MCGPTRVPLDCLDRPSLCTVNEGFPVLQLPKSVALNALASSKRADVESCSSPRAYGCSGAIEELHDYQYCGAWRQHADAGKTGTTWQLDSSSLMVSPRSACSTPGGADNSMGIQLHALVFSQQRQQQERQRRSTDLQSSLVAQTCTLASGIAIQQAQHPVNVGLRALPHRNRTSHDLRRPSQESSKPWTGGYNRSSGYMLNSIAAIGLNGSPTSGSSCMQRGSISKAKLVLAEAINSIPGAHGFSDYSPATCDTGVLSPLLTIIRQNGCVSRRSSFSEAASTVSSCSSTSTGCGFATGSSRVALASALRSCSGRLSRCSSSGDGDESCIPPTVDEHGPTMRCDSVCHTELLMQHRQRQRAAQTQKVVDCIDTVKYLSMDDSNRMALIDLGAVELLLSKLQPAAKPAPTVAAAALGALAAICKHDALKQQLWDNPDSTAILQLLSGKHVSAVVKAAHQAAGQLAWSVDGCAGTCCGTSTNNHGSVFDSITSSHFSSADSDSSCSGANVLLEPALVPALAEALHPAADVPVLLSALRLLSKAAGSIQSEVPAPPLFSQSSGSSAVEKQHRQAAVGWHKVLFALMPLLIPTQRRQGHLVLNAALELLVVLTEQHAGLHTAVCTSGCMPPLLAQMLQGSSEQSLQAACILTGLVDCRAAQERLAQEPALTLLLRILQDSCKSVDVRLAAVHMLKRLAACVPSCVAVLKMQSAVPAVLSLLQQVQDSDVRHAAAGLLQLLGMKVVLRTRRGGNLNVRSSLLPHERRQR